MKLCRMKGFSGGEGQGKKHEGNQAQEEELLHAVGSPYARLSFYES